MDGDINRNQPLFDTQNRIFLSARSPISNHHLDRQALDDSSSNTILTQQQICEISNRLIPVYINMNRRETMEEHSTIYYNTPELVLRRGREFSCILIFNQAFQPDKYQLIIVFKPQTSRNFPVIKIPLNESSNGWSVKITDAKDENQKKNQLHLRVYSSPSALIGKYSLFLEIRSADKEEPCVFQFESDFYLICNPWKDEDSCGLLSNDQIAEYVMNEHGEIYLGSGEIPQSIPWYFGQFESPVLPTALTVLNRIQLPLEQRIDISIILRILAARICSDPGTSNGIFRSLLDVQPLSCMQNAYTSSPAILKQFAASNGRSVAGDSGTIWQHAAVFCSLCRSLGIPCRVVTIYNAISDAKSNSNLTCPWYLWNECWIRRDDVPQENSGWQVVHSSFNPTDTNTRRLGPCSVLALKKGSLDLKCDTPAIHSLVNGNQKLANDGTKRKILTKSSKDNQEFDDLTSDYTSSEASNSTSSNQDVQIDMEIPDSLKPSENLTVILKANNQSNIPRTLILALSLFRINPIEQSRDNQGHRIPIQSSNQVLRLDPNQSKTIPLKVAENHQVWTGCFDSVLQLTMQGRIQETGQNYRREKYILNGENITMKLFLEDDVIEIGQSTKLNIEIKNSPSHTWNHGHITVDGFGILESLSIRKDSSSNDSTKIPFRIVPTRMGLGRLYVTFSTESLCLPPQTILLEVTGWAKKKFDADYHLPAKESSLQELLQTSADEESLGNDNQFEDNLGSTSGIFTAPTKVDDIDKTINEQQETSVISTSEPPNEVDKPSADDLRPILINEEVQKSTVENLEKPLLSEQKTETPSTTTTASLQSVLKTTEELEKNNEIPSDAAIIKELPLESAEAPQLKTEVIEQTTKIEEISQEQDAPDKTPSEGPKETVTRNEDANERDDQTTLSAIPPVDQTVTGTTIVEDNSAKSIDQTSSIQDKNEDEERRSPREIPTSSVTVETTTESITSEKDKKDTEDPLSSAPTSDEITRTENEPVVAAERETEQTVIEPLAQSYTTEEKKEDDQSKQLEAPSADRTIETAITKEVEEDGTGKPTQASSTDQKTEVITEGTPVAEKEKDEEPKLSSIPPTERSEVRVTETISVQEHPEDLQYILSKPSPQDSTKETIAETKEDRNQPEQSPSLDTTDEKKQASIDTNQLPISSPDTTTVDKTKISDIPVTDNKIEVVTKVTTVEDTTRNDQEQGLTTSADSKVEIPQETKQDDENKLPLRTSPESITEVTTIETVSNTKQSEVPQNLSTDFPDKTVIDQDRSNDETQQPDKNLPLNTAAELIVNKQEDTTVPSLQTSVVDDTTVDEEKKDVEKVKSPPISSPDTAVQTVADQPASKASSFIITKTETVTETKPIEDRQDTNEEQLQTISPKETTSEQKENLIDNVRLETPTETLIQQKKSEEQGQDDITPTDDTSKPPVETTSADGKTEINATAPAVQAEEDIPDNKFSTATSPLNLAEKAPPTETDVQTSPLDSTPHSRSADDHAEPLKTEDKQEVTDITPLKTASPGDTTEADIAEQRSEDEKTNALKTSSPDEKLQTMDAVSPVQQENKIEDNKSSDIPAIETDLQTVTTEPSTPKKETEKLVETVTEGDDSTNTTSSDTTKDLIPTVSKTSSSEEPKADNEAQLQSADRPEAPLAQPLLREVEGTDTEPSMSEASSFDNVSEVPHKTYSVDDEAEDRDTDLPKFPNRNAALKAATDMSSTEPGNRLTPASRCYSVETVIDTITVGDKTEEVELIVLKPQSWYDSTTSLNSTTTDTDNETSEQEGSRPDGTSVETATPNYRIETVTQTVKVGDQDEEVETIVLKAPSLNDITDASAENATTEKDATNQETKSSDLPSSRSEAEEEKSSNTPFSDTRVEIIKQTETTGQKDDNAETSLTTALSQPEQSETSVETVIIDNNAAHAQEDPVASSVQDVKEAEPSIAKSFGRPSTSEVEETDTDPFISEASSFENLSETPYRTYIVDDEAEDRDTDLPKFPNRNAATDMSSTQAGQPLTRASRCYSVETVIDTITVGDKTEEVELIVLKPQAWYDSTISLNEPTIDADNKTSEQQRSRVDDASVEGAPPDYRTETVTQTVKVGDQDEEVETIVLKAPSLDDITGKSEEVETGSKDASDQETRSADLSSSEPELNKSSTLSLVEEEKLSSAPSLDAGIEKIVATEQKDNSAETTSTKPSSPPEQSEGLIEPVTIDIITIPVGKDLSKIVSLDTVVPSEKEAEPQTGDRLEETLAQPVTSDIEEPSMSEASSFDNVSEVPYRTSIVDDEMEDHDTDLPKFPNRNAALKAATDMSSTEPGNRLTPASRCYSVETVIDTITVGDKTEEVELIVLKPQAWYDSTISLNEPNIDADNKTSEEQGSRGDETSVEGATPDYRTKTVTQTVKVGDQDEEVETIILKAPSLTDISEKPGETATTEKDATDLKTNLSSISSSEERTEPTSSENPASRIIEAEKQSSPSQTVPETKNVRESTVESEKRKSWKVPSLGDQIEIEIPSIAREGKENDEEMVLQKAPSTDDIALETKQITNIEQRKDEDQTQPTNIQSSTITAREEKSSSRIPSLDITTGTIPSIRSTEDRGGKTGAKLPPTDSVTELQTTEETRENISRPLFKVPSLGDIMDTLTVTRMINNGVPDERMAISEPPSVQNITEMFSDEAETQESSEDERQSSPDIPSLNKIGNTKEANRRSLPKVPSLGDIPETIRRASSVEGKKEEEEERRFPKIPSLDIGTSKDDKESKDIETETVTTTVEDKEKTDPITLSGSPYLGNISNIVAGIIGTPPETPSSSTINTVTETSTTEERRPSQEYTIPRVPSLENIVGTSNNLEEADRRQLPRVPSLEDMTEKVITTTTTVEEIKPEEIKLPKVPSLDLRSDTVSQKENTEDANESELLTSSPLEMPTKTVPEVSIIEENTESNGRRLPKVPSLEDLTQTGPVATTDTDEQNEDKRKLPRVPSLDFTTEILTKPVITEVKQDDEEVKLQTSPPTEDDVKSPETEEKKTESQSPDISSTSNTVETISGPPTVNIPPPENVLLDCSFETVPRNVETEKQSVPPETEDESSSLTESTTVSSVFDTIQSTANNDETTTETLSTASTFESEPITLEKTDSTTDDTDSSASTIQQDTTTTTENVTSSEPTTATTEETKTDEESDSSAEDLKDWLDGLLQQLSAADETERDREVSILRSSAQLAPPLIVDDTNKEIDASEKSTSEDLTSGLDDRLQQLSTTEETSTKIEPAESNALVEKTTVITETTTTTMTNDEDSPMEASSRILKYLVLQTGASDDSDVDDDSKTEENNDSITTVVAAETPLTTSNINTGVTTEDTVNIPKGETITDRAYINAHRDANLTVSDGSAVAIISEGEGQNSRGLDPRSNSMSTMKDADSFSDTMVAEIDHDVSNEDIVSLIQYADALSDDILESAVLWTLDESYDTTPSGSPTHDTSSEQFITSESSLITDEPKLIANTSIKFAPDNEETISDKSNGQ